MPIYPIIAKLIVRLGQLFEEALLILATVLLLLVPMWLVVIPYCFLLAQQDLATVSMWLVIIELIAGAAMMGGIPLAIRHYVLPRVTVLQRTFDGN